MAEPSGELPVTDYPDVAAFRKAATPHEWNVVTSLAGAPNATLLDSQLVDRMSAIYKDLGARRSALNRALSTLEHARVAGRAIVERTAEGAHEKPDLTDLGKVWAVEGLPERRLFELLRARSPLTIEEARSDARFKDGTCGNAIGRLKRAGTIAVEGGALRLVGSDLPDDCLRLERILTRLHKFHDVEPAGESPLDARDREVIRQHSQGRGSSAQPLNTKSQSVHRIRLLQDVSAFRGDYREDFAHAAAYEERNRAPALGLLTPDVLRDGSWKGRPFRPWNVSLTPAAPPIGRRHPYREYLDNVKRKLAAMGFVEMVGNLVETEFWNMDALFMPQFHPAREIHDVYGVRSADAGKGSGDFARAARVGDEGTVANVAAAHENGGGTGSTGWRYHFDLERAKQLILRSHGTALSARQLGTLGKAGVRTGKYFAVARCFRCDTIDATHAADFFQIEGIVLGPDINFRSLLGLLHLFGYEIARAKECRFVPAYFPFTEPSVEVHMRHPELGWMELGGAGIFRPELTAPLGIDVPVIAWGLGIDRMAMVALGVNDIRDLFHADLVRLRSMRYPG